MKMNLYSDIAIFFIFDLEHNFLILLKFLKFLNKMFMINFVIFQRRIVFVIKGIL